MVYTDPLFEARRKSIIAGTAATQTPTISQPVRTIPTTGFVDQNFEKRRVQVLQNTQPLPALSTQPAQPVAKPANPVLQKLKDAGVRTARNIGASLGYMGANLLDVATQMYERELKKKQDIADRIQDPGLKAKYVKSQLPRDEADAKAFTREWSTKLKKWSEETSPENPTFVDQVVQGVGSMGAFVAISALTGGGAVAPAVTEALMEGSNVYEQRRSEGKSVAEASQYADKDFLSNLVVTYFTDKIGVFSDAARGIKKAFMSAGAEGVQEGLQQLIQNSQTGRPLMEGVPEAAGVGATLGGGFSFVLPGGQREVTIDVKNNPEYADMKPPEPKEKVVEVKPTEVAKPASSGVQLAEQGIFAELSDDQLNYLKDEVGNIQFTKDDKPHLSPLEKLELSDMKKVTLEELRAASPNLDKALKAYEEQKRAQEAVDEGQKYDYSSTQLDIPENVARQFVDFANTIPSDQVYTDKTTKGREDFPHITVVYGLDTANPTAIKPLLEGIDPIKVELGDVSVFKNDDYDVVKVDVISKQLDELNKKISELSTPGQTFDTYQPHITIAYVKKGQGAKYIGDQRFRGQSITLDNLTFSGKDGKVTTLPLGVKSESSAKKPTFSKDEQAKVDKMTKRIEQAIKEKDQGFLIGLKTAYESSNDENLKKITVQAMKDARDNVTAEKAKGDLSKAKDKKEVTLKSTDELVKYISEGGYRSDEQIAKLRADIIKFGVMYPITIVEDGNGGYTINDGNHRIQIAKDLGIKELPVKVYDKSGNNITKKSTLSSAEANQNLRDYYAKQGEANPEEVGQAWYEVMMEMEVAAPGQKVFDDYGEFKGSISSTFPQFVPEELRSSKLFNTVMSGVADPTNMTYPPNSQPRRQALYDAILAEIDSRAGTDSATLIEDIKEAYAREQEAKKQTTKPTSSSTQRSERETRAKEIKSFPGVASGLASTGAEKISNFELRNPPKTGTEEFKLYKKVQGLIRKYADRVGEGYTPRGALGVYYPKTKNIRVNAMNDLSVASHEITHFLDATYNITEKIWNGGKGDSGTIADLQRLYLQYYPQARETQKMNIQLKEGYATLLQKYVEMPTTITKEYPSLVKNLLQPKGKYYKEVIGDIIKDLNEIVGDYQGLPALDKIGARVSTEATGIDKSSFMNFWQRLRTQLFDKIYPVEVIAQKAKVGFTKEDPSLWLRAYSSINGIVDNNIASNRGFWTFTNSQEGFQKKYDYNWKSLLDSTQKRGITDSLGFYLVARRQHFDYIELDQLNAKLDEVTKLHEAVKDAKEIKDIDRDTLATLSEDYGIDVKEVGLDTAKVKVARRLESATKARDDVAGVLERDAFNREDVDSAYEENRERFRSEEGMYDSLVAEDLALLNNEEVQLIDKSTYNQLKSKEGYASFKRQFYDELVGEGDMPGAVRVGKTKVSSMISRKGSQRTIINPLLSALTNHSEILKKSMKQLVYNKIGAIGESAILPGLFQEVQVKAAVEKGSGKISFPQEKDPNIIMARKDYKRKAILTNTEVKATIDTLLTYRNIDTFEQLWTGLTRTFTAGTTALYPQFALTNFAVDQITATANSFNKFKGLYSPLKEIGNIFSKRNKTDARYFQEYLVMGGERQTFAGWQRLAPEDLIKRITDEKSKLQHGIDLLQKGVDIASIPSAKSELLSRATEYMNSRRAGKSQIVALEEAGRVTAPFHHIGAWGAKQGTSFGQTFIRGLPFFNATLQVIDQAARTANTKEGRKRMTFITIAVTAAYLAAITAMMGADDEQKKQYHDLTADDLVNFIYLPNPSGEGLVRVKIANQFSIPGTVINMIIANKMFSARYGMGDVLQASTAWLPTQLQLYDAKNILSWIPQLFKPIAYTVLNVKDYPKVMPLVSQGLSKRPPAQQFNEGTSAFAKKLGEWLNVSPIKVDYLLTGYLGRASGFLTGKPGIYNPAASILREYYFTSGKSVSDYYETKEKNDAIYTAYQNYEGKFAELSKDEAKEVYRIKQTTDKIEKMLGEYRDMDIKEKPEEAAEMRTKILLYIDKLNNGEKMSSAGAWSLDAKQRRLKNKPKK